jgi:hypothetical protein
MKGIKYYAYHVMMQEILPLALHHLMAKECKMAIIRYFETQPNAATNQLHWYNTWAFMDIKLIHKPSKDNVVPYALSHKEE